VNALYFLPSSFLHYKAFTIFSVSSAQESLSFGSDIRCDAKPLNRLIQRPYGVFRVHHRRLSKQVTANCLIGISPLCD